MPSTSQLIVSIMLVFAAVFVGHHLGSTLAQRYATTKRRFLLLNGGALLFCVIAGMVASLFQSITSALPLFAVGCSMFVGLKSGASRNNSNLWVLHDKTFNINTEERMRRERILAAKRNAKISEHDNSQEFISVSSHDAQVK